MFFFFFFSFVNYLVFIFFFFKTTQRTTPIVTDFPIRKSSRYRAPRAVVNYACAAPYKPGTYTHPAGGRRVFLAADKYKYSAETP